MLTYRPALPDDFEFLFRLHEAVMRAYAEDTFGPWDEDWQRNYFRMHFDLEAVQVIQYNDWDVGALWVQERVEELFLVSLEILPQFQRRGIGTAVIRALIERGREEHKPVALQVLKVNLEARDLYQRLGFGVTGENDTHYIMSWELR